MLTLSMRIVTYLLEYLGEFKVIFKTILDYESGDQMGSFDAKKRHRISHAWAPLRVQSKQRVSSKFSLHHHCVSQKELSYHQK